MYRLIHACVHFGWSLNVCLCVCVCVCVHARAHARLCVVHAGATLGWAGALLGRHTEEAGSGWGIVIVW